MAETPDALKKDIEKTKEQLLALRDELKVKIHLASLDAKEAWAGLSKDIEKLGAKIGHDLTEQTRSMTKELLERAKKLHATLKR